MVVKAKISNQLSCSAHCMREVAEVGKNSENEASVKSLRKRQSMILIEITSQKMKKLFIRSNLQYVQQVLSFLLVVQQ